MFKTNEYFDGKVKSIAYDNNGQAASIGVMAPGEYVFNTGEKEKMSVISGAMTIKLADDTRRTYQAGESFYINANSSFDVAVSTETAYLCLYG